jgi:hypothetical protein
MSGNMITLKITEEAAMDLLNLRDNPGLNDEIFFAVDVELYRNKITSMSPRELTQEFLSHHDDGFLSEFLVEQAANDKRVTRKDLEDLLIAAKQDGVF